MQLNREDPKKDRRGLISNHHLKNTYLGDMNEDTEMSTYQQANSFAQDPLDETTSMSDLTAPIEKRPFRPIEQVYLKAFIKLT